MLRSVFALTLIAFAFVACKKNKTEDPPIDKQQYQFTLGGTWREVITTSSGPDGYMFNTPDSTYRRIKASVGITERGAFHTRAFNNPDSLEVHLLHDTLIIVKLNNIQIKITEGDTTRVFKKATFPG